MQGRVPGSDKLLQILTNMVRFNFRNRYKDATQVLEALQSSNPAILMPKPLKLSQQNASYQGNKISDRLLQLDDVRNIETPEKIANLFQKLGYNAVAQPLSVEDLQLPTRSTEAIYDAYMIADQGNGGLQILLFHLQSDEWASSSTASSRMKAIANSLCRRNTHFLLLGTKDYNQLMLVNTRKTFDAQMNLKTSIRKLLIDRTNPTNYDRDRLEAIAARNLSPDELYKTQCEAFDVEKLTKQFYQGYKDLFEKVQTVIKEHNSHPYFDDDNRLHQFSQRLLGRLMFLYFLQKKEFLAGDRNFLTTQYRRLKLDPDDFNYYAEILEPLFFETLNQQRTNLESPWGRIPYLNGGLFDRDYGEGTKDAVGRETPPQIQLPNSLFDPSGENTILGFFNGYNFTIAENVQSDEDVAVDPEMLGKVFENMLAAEERGQSGTFYTPRGIVQFMCTEVLSRYLSDESGMSLDAIKQIIELDPDLPDASFNQLLTKEQARKLKQALETVKILDPAVGSGAFPLGMMQVILTVKQAIARQEGMTVKRGSLAISQWKRDIIANNLYGVDIKPEAIEIAKLRMWLSLVVDIPDVEDVEPLPNLDYKLMCGDSLISTIHGEQLIPDPTKTQQLMLAVTPIQQAIQPLLELQRQYFDAQSKERKVLRDRILEAEANVFRVAVADRRQYWVTKQQDLERNIKTMKGKVTRAQEKERAEVAAKLAELDKFALEVESGERSLNFFQYHLHFRDVFEGKGGFDVVIGNPPYVGQKNNKEIFEEIRKGSLGRFYQRNCDILYFFFHLALDVCHIRSYVAFITTNYFLTADSAKTLRKDLKKRSNILKLINFNELRIFQSAKGQHNIVTILSKYLQSMKDYEVDIYSTNRRGDATSEMITNIVTKNDEMTDYFFKNINNLYEGEEYFYIRISESYNIKDNLTKGWSANTTNSIIDKIKTRSNSLLGKICPIGRGLQTGADKISDKHINKGLAKLEHKNQGIYILSEQELINVGLAESELSIIKPFFKNSDIKKYYCNQQPKLFVIYATREVEIENYPRVYSHLQNFEKIIKSRSYDRGEIQAALQLGKWWVIFSAKEQRLFELPKIVCPQRSLINCFAYTEAVWYSSCDVYYIGQPLIEKTNLKYLLGLLNSRIVYFWLYHKGKRKGESLELYHTPLTQIPIPTASEADRLAIEALVQKCLDAKGQGIEEWEAEIDDRVAHLYGLTAEEMKLIRGE